MNWWHCHQFMEETGDPGPPYAWDPDRRFHLRCQLDAAFFHIYRLSRADTDYFLGTFPIIRKNEERDHGEFRTRRVVLEEYERMAASRPQIGGTP